LQGYFSFWVILSITWGLLATIVSTFLPLWESRDTLWTVTKNVFTCTVPTAEEEVTGKAEPGDFARQVGKGDGPLTRERRGDTRRNL
jgi:hypothetical protein